MKFLFSFLFTGLLLISCQSQETVKGFYTSGWEWSQFEPCSNLDEWWWVTGSDNFYDQYESLIKAKGDTTIGSYVYLEVTGTKTPKGKYGHMSQYEREFEIKKVFVMEYQKDLEMGDKRAKEKICSEK